MQNLYRPQTRSNQEIDRMEKQVVIIGAGISGLVACKSILSKGFNPIVFEADENIGGVWAHTIQSTRLQNTKEVYQFTDFPWPSHVQDIFPTHNQVMEYLQAYATHFKVFPYIKFNSTVLGIDYVGENQEQMESWDLWCGNGKPFGSKGTWHVKVQNTKNLKIEVYHAEFVILCNGQFNGVTNIPEFPPNQGPEVYRGKVMHSIEFSALDDSSADELIKRKRVTVIGSHKSALDLAAQCANSNAVAYPCTIVQRTAHWLLGGDNLCGMIIAFLCLNRFSELWIHKPGETLLLSLLATFLSPLRWTASKFVECFLRWKYPLKKYGMLPKISFHDDSAACQIAMLPEKFYDKVEQGSIIIRNSRKFIFCQQGLILDGETKPIETDVVIFATGYKGIENIRNIFESPIFEDYITNSPISGFPFYRQIIHPRIPRLAVIGYNESFSSLSGSEMKSIWLAKFLDGEIELPRIKDMEDEVKLWGDHIKQLTGRHFRRACYKANIWYNDQLCKDMGFDPRRKKSFLADLFVPYGPNDYAFLTAK